MNKKIKIIGFLSLLMLNMQICYCQYSLNGKITDAQQNVIEYFQISILNPEDSTLLTGGSFVNGHFEIRQNQEKSILKISAPGYKDRYFPVYIREQSSKTLETVELEKNVIELSETVVRANMPRVKIEQDKMVVNIENTLISDAGTAVDVLRRTPFVLVDANSNISVAGRENTLILLNGRQIRSNEEISFLNSSDIKRIEVIENPSSKYDAEGHAIINIITVKANKPQLNASLYSRFSHGRTPAFTESAELSCNVSGLSFYLRYAYSHSENEGFNNDRMQYDKANYSFKSWLYDVENKSKLLRHSYNFGFDYAPNDKHKIGMQADGYFTNRSSAYLRYLEIERNGIENPAQESRKRSDAKSQSNTFGVNYSYKDTLGFELNVIADYTGYSSPNTENIHETNAIQSYESLLKNMSTADYSLFSAKIDGIIPLKKISSRLEVGSKFSMVDNKSAVDFYKYQTNQWDRVDEYSSNASYTEKLLAFYVLLAGKLKKWDYTLGMRMENDNVTNKDQSDLQTTLRNERFSLFPNISAGYRINENYSISMSYSRRISRPGYATLNNTLYYLDSLSTRQGNPYLKSTFFNTLSLKTVLNKNIVATVTYSFIEDPVDLMFINDNVHIEQFTIIRKNTKNTRQIGFNISGSFNYKIWATQPFLSYGYRPSAIVDNDTEYVFKNPYYTISWNNQFSLPKSWVIEANLSYSQPGGSYMDFGKQLDFNIGVRKKLLKDRLTIQFAYYDGLYKWTQHYQYSYKTYNMTYDDERRYASISLRYNFNAKSPSFKKKSASEEERNRM
ncbi:MAG: TonB-dependent receptor [Prevotellaceae bacterium]|jgi:hypothetical protein|nr:TonB-dependent receptor [Prevotellaceae bacterium]